MTAPESLGHWQCVTPAFWFSQPTRLVNVPEWWLLIGSRRREVSQFQVALRQLSLQGPGFSVLLFIFVHDPVGIFNSSFNNLLDSLRAVFI